MTLAQSATEGGYLTIVSTVIGGAISGLVGLAAVLYNNKQQDKQRLKDNVYRKLYGYTFRLLGQNLPTNWVVPTDEWTKLEPYELIKMDQKIKDEFDGLYVEIEYWNKFCNGLESNYFKHEPEIQKTLQDAFSQSGLLNPNGGIAVRDSNYAVEGFLRIYWMAIMNPEIKDSEALFKTMAEYAQKYDSYRVGDVTYLKETKPSFFDIVAKQLPLLREMCLADFNYDDMMKLRETIRNHVRTLNSELKKLAK